MNIKFQKIISIDEVRNVMKRSNVLGKNTITKNYLINNSNKISFQKKT